MVDQWVDVVLVQVHYGVVVEVGLDIHLFAVYVVGQVVDVLQVDGVIVGIVVFDVFEVDGGRWQ